MKLFDVFLEVYLVSKKGEHLKYKRILKQRSRSFVQQWIQGMRALLTYANEANVRNTANALVNHSYAGMYIKAALGDATLGVVLGTGDTPVTISDYKLETQIAHGNGAGQLYHAIMVFDAFEVVGSTARFKSKRLFSNNSGNTITVKESGLYGSDTSANRFCYVRDVLASPQDILNGQTIEVRYTLQAAV
jgi:hypothetical protein